MITLEDYVRVIFPIIELILRHGGKDIKSRHVYYLYHQIFYGFTEFIDESKIKVSKEAKSKFDELKINGDLKKMRWVDQKKFDKNRKNFHLEHMYTGTMFRNDVEALYKNNELSVGSICELIKNKYVVAWITKEENNRLNKSGYKSKRENIDKAYKDAGIELE